MTTIRIRPGRIQDAEVIARMANEHNVLYGKLDDLYSTRLIEDDAFGPDPAFETLVAELDGDVVGFATFEETYNPDLPARTLWLFDLFVIEPARGQGIGRKLLATVADIAVRRGRPSVAWGVYTGNTRARRFYAGLGARDEDARILELDGEALKSLAMEAKTLD